MEEVVQTPDQEKHVERESEKDVILKVQNPFVAVLNSCEGLPKVDRDYMICVTNQLYNAYSNKQGIQLFPWMAERLCALCSGINLYFDTPGSQPHVFRIVYILTRTAAKKCRAVNLAEDEVIAWAEFCSWWIESRAVESTEHLHTEAFKANISDEQELPKLVFRVKTGYIATSPSDAYIARYLVRTPNLNQLRQAGWDKKGTFLEINEVPSLIIVAAQTDENVYPDSESDFLRYISVLVKLEQAIIENTGLTLSPTDVETVCYHAERRWRYTILPNSSIEVFQEWYKSYLTHKLDGTHRLDFQRDSQKDYCQGLELSMEAFSSLLSSMEMREVEIYARQHFLALVNTLQKLQHVVSSGVPELFNMRGICLLPIFQKRCAHDTYLKERIHEETIQDSAICKIFSRPRIDCNMQILTRDDAQIVLDFFKHIPVPKSSKEALVYTESGTIQSRALVILEIVTELGKERNGSCYALEWIKIPGLAILLQVSLQQIPQFYSASDRTRHVVQYSLFSRVTTFIRSTVATIEEVIVFTSNETRFLEELVVALGDAIILCTGCTRGCHGPKIMPPKRVDWENFDLVRDLTDCLGDDYHMVLSTDEYISLLDIHSEKQIQRTLLQQELKIARSELKTKALRLATLEKSLVHIVPLLIEHLPEDDLVCEQPRNLRNNLATACKGADSIRLKLTDNAKILTQMRVQILRKDKEIAARVLEISETKTELDRIQVQSKKLGKALVEKVAANDRALSSQVKESVNAIQLSQNRQENLQAKLSKVSLELESTNLKLEKALKEPDTVREELNTKSREYHDEINAAEAALHEEGEKYNILLLDFEATIKDLETSKTKNETQQHALSRFKSEYTTLKEDRNRIRDERDRLRSYQLSDEALLEAQAHKKAAEEALTKITQLESARDADQKIINEQNEQLKKKVIQLEDLRKSLLEMEETQNITLDQLDKERAMSAKIAMKS